MREFRELSTPEVAALAASLDPTRSVDLKDPSSHLSKILIPRAPGTENNTFVKNYIASTLKALNWEVVEDTFNDTTPYGERTFTNVIATKDPRASNRVIVSAHFDSKYFSGYPQNQFVGATDSAAPCAFMLDLAEALNPLLDARSQRFEDGLEDDEDVADTTLQLVFFDGEEALKDWTATDSIYGARHLVDEWSSTYIPPNAKRRLRTSATELNTIEHLILLDLLGAPNPTIRSFFPDTGWLFDAMVAAESRLAESGLIDAGGSQSFTSFFTPRTGYESGMGFIEDDHLPFLRHGVPILHVIANPFPRVWHTLKDDASALDLATMRRWNLILRVLMAEYLNLRPEVTSRRSTDEL